MFLDQFLYKKYTHLFMRKHLSISHLSLNKFLLIFIIPYWIMGLGTKGKRRIEYLLLNFGDIFIFYIDVYQRRPFISILNFWILEIRQTLKDKSKYTRFFFALSVKKEVLVKGLVYRIRIRSRKNWATLNLFILVVQGEWT